MIGKRIQAMRQARGLSLSDVAERAGVAKSYLSSIERDIQKNPSIAFLEKVAAVLGVPVKRLLQLEEAIDPVRDEWLSFARHAQQSGVPLKDLQEYVDFLVWKQSQSGKG